MELVTRDADTVTIKFRSIELVNLVTVTGAAAQGYADLDIELLDHLTNEEVGTLYRNLMRLGRKPQNA